MSLPVISWFLLHRIVASWKTTPAFPNQPEALASCKNTTEANFAGLRWEWGKSCVPTSYVDSWSIEDSATSTLLLLALFSWSHASPEEVKACETFCNLSQITSFAHLMTKLWHEGRSKVKAPTAALCGCGYIAKLGTPEIHAFPTEQRGFGGLIILSRNKKSSLCSSWAPGLLQICSKCWFRLVATFHAPQSLEVLYAWDQMLEKPPAKHRNPSLTQNPEELPIKLVY